LFLFLLTTGIPPASQDDSAPFVPSLFSNNAQPSRELQHRVFAARTGNFRRFVHLYHFQQQPLRPAQRIIVMKMKQSR
jgi:hypothetical protein